MLHCVLRKCTLYSYSQYIKGGFSLESEKILGGVQVICNMPFLMLREGHEMAPHFVFIYLHGKIINPHTMWYTYTKYPRIDPRIQM